jgi:hypothetical protein
MDGVHREQVTHGAILTQVTNGMAVLYLVTQAGS